MAAIEVADLRKEYGPIRAVDGVSFDVAEGEVYALLGENGAGKSTTVEILEGHRRRTSGTVRVLGEDPGVAGRELRDRIGIVLQSSGVEHELTVREAVTIYASCYSRRRPVDEVIELVGLTPQLDQRVGHLSGGQRRRLDLALGIVGIARPALPRRADDRVRPGRPSPRVGARPRALLGWDDGAADDALPRRGRAPRRPRRVCWPAAGSSPRARPTS